MWASQVSGRGGGGQTQGTWFNWKAWAQQGSLTVKVKHGGVSDWKCRGSRRNDKLPCVEENERGQLMSLAGTAQEKVSFLYGADTSFQLGLEP